MGLDMYLEGDVYIGGAYHNIKETELTVSKAYKRSGEEDDYTDCDFFPTENLDRIVYRVGYWRKANQIHHWFVQNVQAGVDDCHRYEVTKEQLDELKSLCEGLLKDKDKDRALSELPPQSGFFFGNSDPNNERFWEDYWYDLELTIKNLEVALKYVKDYNADIYYQSSW